jgi:hydrogenase expression/formation protein HypD
VRENGNERAQAIIEKVFEPCQAEWRGLGPIAGSGLVLREPWGRFDAALRHGQAAEEVLAKRVGLDDRARKKSACRCGRVLRGELLPPECPLFGLACTPIEPAGPCMVSSEGSCAAYYRYERRG